MSRVRGLGANVRGAAIALAAALPACTTILGLERGVPDPLLDAGPADAPPDGASAQAYRAAVLSDVPSAYYPFDEPAGAPHVHSVVSGSGAEWDGAVSGASLGAAGALADPRDGAVRIAPPTGAVHFNAAKAPTGNAPFTFEVWVRLEGAAPERRILLARSSGTEGYDLVVEGRDVVFHRTTAQGATAVSAAGALTVGTYTHFAITYDTSSLRLYRDGDLAMTQPSTWTIAAPAGELLVGSDDGSKPAAAALVDELAFYPAALPPDRIRAHVAAAR